MGKLSGIIQFTGKLGETVGMRGRNGRSYIRAKKDTIRNPKTAGQLIQRAIFTTASRAVSELKEILSNGFEGVAFGLDSLSYARKLYTEQLRQLAANGQGRFNARNHYGIAPNPLLVSRGSLNGLQVNEIDNSTTYAFAVTTGATIQISAATTASQIFPNVAIGDQITFVCVYDEQEPNNIGHVLYCRFAFKSDTVPAFITSTNGFKLNPAAIDITLAEGEWDKIEVTETGSANVISISPNFSTPFGVGNGIVAAAAIVSNKVNKTRSTASLTLSTEATTLYESLNEAYPTYGDTATPISVPSDYYLQNSVNNASGD